MDGDQRVIMIGAHVGNWEIGTPLFNDYIKKMNVVMYDAEHQKIKEILKKNIGGHMYTNEKETSCRYTARLEKEELANQSISEQGLFDEDGDLVAYITFLPKGKDEGMVFIFDMDEIF